VELRVERTKLDLPILLSPKSNIILSFKLSLNFFTSSSLSNRSFSERFGSVEKSMHHP